MVAACGHGRRASPEVMKKQPSINHLGHLFGWLGRQVGHVKKAIQADPAAPKPAPRPQVVYREDKVEEADHPSQPGVKLRRTVIDEVIVDQKTLNNHEGAKTRSEKKT